ncbi:MAG TPA: hypothetical protein VKS01_05110 [Bryobacteraceae bacterium]|nr:hypothetical protein [Bryobacteraceae bacterium]
MSLPFLQSIVDYAGLFPPAALPLAEAVANYARYRKSPESWMLAKFVVPIARAAEVDPSFPLSVLSSGDFTADARLLAKLPNADAIEIKASDAATIESAARSLPDAIEKYFEIVDLSLLPAIAARHARAKIRTGGVTPEAFPDADFIVRFLIACAQSSVPFKATAGLHHPLRCYRRLTYAQDSPSGWMYGFLNLFIAAAHAADASTTEIREILLREAPDSFPEMSPILSRERTQGIAFGSCSFEEPVADLKALNLL